MPEHLSPDDLDAVSWQRRLHQQAECACVGSYLDHGCELLAEVERLTTQRDQLRTLVEQGLTLSRDNRCPIVDHTVIYPATWERNAERELALLDGETSGA